MCDHCVHPVTDAAALEALASEWRALWAACPDATPFQHPAWLLPWWRHVGEGGLWTLAVRENGRLVGLLPLYVYTAPGEARQQVFPLGIATTDYLDALFAPGRSERGMAAAFAHMDANRDRWDVCDFPQLRPGSPLLCADAPEGWSDAAEPGEACPVLALAGPVDADGFPKTIPAAMRKNRRYDLRRAEREAAVTFETATRDTWAEHYAALLDLHRARWETRGEAGVLADPRVQAAHRETIPLLLKAGLLRMHALRLDGRIIAVYYGLSDPPRPMRRAYYYLGGFDPAMDHLSPGTLLVGYAIRSAACESSRAFDFLRGGELYKYRWGAADQPTWRRRLTAE
jgi:CelD/BcsL family acetyltransferase involved in cellulose biosynthesis